MNESSQGDSRRPPLCSHPLKLPDALDSGQELFGGQPCEAGVLSRPLPTSLLLLQISDVLKALVRPRLRSCVRVCSGSPFASTVPPLILVRANSIVLHTPRPRTSPPHHITAHLGPSKPPVSAHRPLPSGSKFSWAKPQNLPACFLPSSLPSPSRPPPAPTSHSTVPARTTIEASASRRYLTS